MAGVGPGRFTVTDRAGQSIDVVEQYSTNYFDGLKKSTAAAVTPGAEVAVRGERSGTIMTARSVTVIANSGIG